MKEHVIELNRKRYNAVTGAYLGTSNVVPRHVAQRYVRGRSIKNFFTNMSEPAPEKKPEVPTATTENESKVEVATKSKAAQEQPVESEQIEIPVKIRKNGKIIVAGRSVKLVRKPSITQPNNIMARAPQHSKTLVRRHTQKPKVVNRPGVKRVQIPTEVMATVSTSLAAKRSTYGIDPLRQFRASHVDKHPAIAHFTAPKVQPAIAPSRQVIAVEPAPSSHSAATVHVHTPATIDSRAPVFTPKKHSDIFEAAIARADSHEQPAPKIRARRSGKRRVMNALAAVSVFLMVGGFIGYKNLPGIEMRIAATQAGFSASLPTYAPIGYDINGRVQNSGGVVSVSFRSGSSQYSVTQQATSQNGQSIVNNVLGWSSQYQTVQKNGQVIYIYQNDGTNASWVKDGVRYDITGNAQLSKDEVISIATSL